MNWRAVSMAVALLTVAACDLAGLIGPSGGIYPDACDELGFSARRCAAIVRRAEERGRIDPQGVGSIDILPPVSDGGTRLGGQMVARVRFHLAADREQTEEVWCVGVGNADDLACAEDPRLGVSGGVDHDIPCSAEPPSGCATLPPTARPAVQAIARPLHVEALDIRLDHLGRYEVDVGEAGLPDGVLSRRSASLADPSPETFWISGGILLDVRPVDPARPPVGSIYRDPYDGVEPVRVLLVFEVTETTSGAVLQVRDILVE